jgi:3-deoxy-manno-octulosonate cytidylyltransferase (CMP-KDO synthetase)
MKVVGVIPARYQSSRFDGKALALLGGRPLIEHVYRRARQASLLSRLVVATDDERIAEAVRACGGDAIMTSPDHASGTDRVAEAARAIDADVVVNIQGDEPFISARVIDQAVEPFRQRPGLAMTTLRRRIVEPRDLDDPNVVKVVVDRDGFALYFSRARIPSPRRDPDPPTYEHIGLYAYRKDFLLRYSSWPRGELEQVEGLEQLRVLENGIRILAVSTESHVGVSVDTREDLERAERFLAEQGSLLDLP